MIAMSCSTCRLWLQAPDELVATEMAVLSAHLAGCTECRAFQAEIVRQDELLREALTRQDIPSVRPSVLRQLRAPAAPKRRHRRRLLTAVAAIVSAILAIAFPFVTPRGLTPVPPAGAAWHRVLAKIDFHVAIDRSRPDHLLAGVLNNVYESNDGGSTWQRLATLPSGDQIRALVVDSTDASRYLVATHHSILISDDAGKNWRVARLVLPGGPDMFLLQDPRQPAVFYAGPSILWKSSDHGESWGPAGPSSLATVFAPDGIQSLAIERTGILVTGIWAGGVALSFDGGLTWVRRAKGLAKNVMDTAQDASGALWAGTDRGLFESVDGGGTWHRRQTGFITSVVSAGDYLLAGGNHALFRSTDGGRTWKYAMRGLPLDPYINDLIVDPDNPSRVYASLNGDGLFRSTDGGRHWTAINAGIPIPSMVPKQRVIVYRCDGVLCISDINGIDPGVYSVDTVSRAAMAPDGGAVAYLTRWAGRWAVRVLDRGSRPKSALSGRGAAPRQLLWSPDSSLLAAVLPSGVEVTNLAGHVSVVRLALYETVVGWSEGGRSLLIWNSWTGRLSLRSVRTSADVPEPGIFQSAPTMASDRLHLAVVSDGLLLVGQVGKPMRRVARVDPQCTAVAWSVDATRLVLQCGQSVQVRASSGALRRWAHLPDASGWQAEPGNRLLFFHAGGLWEWLPGGRMRPLIANANPA